MSGLGRAVRWTRTGLKRFCVGVAVRANAIEAILGLALIALGLWLTAGVGAACLATGAIVLVFAVWGRKIS